MIARGVTSVQIGLETDAIRTILEVVANNDLFTTMPQSTTTPYVETAPVFLDFDHPRVKHPLDAIRRSDTSENLAEDR